jgi:cyclophilin family peptidyl-prolyl cis-trans isomerase
MFRPLLAGIALTISCALLFGCDSKDPNTTAQNEPAPKADAKTDKDPVVGKGDIAVIETNLGTIKFQFMEDKAPKTVANFEKLAGKKFYDGTAFHRVKPGFMIQGGDPNTKESDSSKYGQGGPGYTIDDEFSDVDITRGIVAMANTGQPNSGGSQFYIVVAPASFLNGKYSVFGKVTEGMDVVDKIVQVKTVGSPTDQVVDINSARIKSITITHASGK